MAPPAFEPEGETLQDVNLRNGSDVESDSDNSIASVDWTEEMINAAAELNGRSAATSQPDAAAKKDEISASSEPTSSTSTDSQNPFAGIDAEGSKPDIPKPAQNDDEASEVSDRDDVISNTSGLGAATQEDEGESVDRVKMYADLTEEEISELSAEERQKYGRDLLQQVDRLVALHIANGDRDDTEDFIAATTNLENILAQFGIDMADLYNDLREFQDSERLHTAEISRLSAENLQQLEQYDALLVENTTLNVLVANKEHYIKKQEFDLQKKTDDINMLLNQRVKDSASYEAKLKAKDAEMLKGRAIFAAQLSRRDAEKVKDKASFEAQLKGKNDEIEALKFGQAAGTEPALRSEIEALEKKLQRYRDAWKRKRDQLKHEVGKLEFELAQAKSSAEAKDIEIAGVHGELEEQDGKLEEVYEELEGLEDEMEELEVEEILMGARDIMLDSHWRYRAASRTQQAAADGSGSQGQARENEAEARRETRDDREYLVEVLRERINTLKKEAENEAAATQYRIAQISDVVQSQKKLSERLSQKCEILTAQLDFARIERDILQEGITSSQHMARDMAIKQEELKKENHRLARAGNGKEKASEPHHFTAYVSSSTSTQADPAYDSELDKPNTSEFHRRKAEEAKMRTMVAVQPEIRNQDVIAQDLQGRADRQSGCSGSAMDMPGSLVQMHQTAAIAQAEHKTHLDRCNNDKEAYRTALFAIQKAHGESKTKTAELEKRLDFQTKSLDRMRKINAKYEEARSRFEQQAQVYDRCFSDARNQNTVLKADNAGLKHDLTTIREEVTSLQGEIQTLRNTNAELEDDIRNTRDELLSHSHVLEALQAHVRHASNLLATREHEIVQKDMAAIALRSQIEEQRTRIVAQETRIQAQNTRIAELLAEKSKYHSHESMANKLEKAENEVEFFTMCLQNHMQRQEGETMYRKTVEARLKKMMEIVGSHPPASFSFSSSSSLKLPVPTDTTSTSSNWKGKQKAVAPTQPKEEEDYFSLPQPQPYCQPPPFSPSAFPSEPSSPQPSSSTCPPARYATISFGPMPRPKRISEGVKIKHIEYASVEDVDTDDE